MNTYKIVTTSQILTVENCINSDEAIQKTGLDKQSIVSVSFHCGLLSHLYDLAYRAHTGTSFSPEERGRSMIREYSEQLADHLSTMPESEKEQYKANFEKYLSAWFRAKGNCISTMITGGSNFPVRRANKANAAEDKRYNEFTFWQANALKSIKKRIELAKPIDQRRAELLAASIATLKKDFDRSASIIMGIDNGTEKGCARPLFVAPICRTVKRIANSGNVELLQFCLDYIRGLNKIALEVNNKPIISDNNSIWKLAVVAIVAKEKKFDNAQADGKEYDFEGGKVVLNRELDRVQIIYNGKPQPAIINTLKQNAFRWSPSNTAWQRQLTANGVMATNKLTGLSIQL